MRPLPSRFPSRLLNATMLTLWAAILQTGSAVGADIEEYLNTPVWYLEYEVSFKAEHQSSETNAIGTFATSISFDRAFSANWPLDLWSQGPSPVLGASFLSGAADGSMPSPEDQMAFAQNLMSRMERASNWTSSGGALTTDENATEEEAAAAMESGMKAAMGPGRIEYLRVDVGKDLVNEMGEHYEMTSRTTRKGSGTVLPGGGQGAIFEIDADSQTYTLVLPVGFNEMQALMTVEKSSRTVVPGQDPIETHQSEEIGLGLFPQDLTIDDPTNIQAAMALIRGKIDPAGGTISGERTMAAHYTDNPQIVVAGTLTFRYTLGTTPPLKSKDTEK